MSIAAGVLIEEGGNTIFQLIAGTIIMLEWAVVEAEETGEAVEVAEVVLRAQEE